MSTYTKMMQYKTLGLMYISGIVLYNAAGSYDSALQCLKRFDQKTPYAHEQHLTTQWAAVKYGSGYQADVRFFE